MFDMQAVMGFYHLSEKLGVVGMINGYPTVVPIIR
jgi:hypothetical protein